MIVNLSVVLIMRTTFVISLSILPHFVKSQSTSPSPLVIPFNTDGGHGPDGPWNYITLNVGSDPASAVDFYPLFYTQASMLVRSDVCSVSQCITPQPGYYNSNASSALQTEGQDINTATFTYNSGANWQNQTLYHWIDNIDTSNLDNIDGSQISFRVTNNSFAYTLFGNGSINNDATYAPMSLLSLEPNASRLDVKLRDGGTAVQNTLLQKYTQSTGGSRIVSLHMGSAVFGQPGSLVFGGYDPGRLIERPGIFNHLGSFPLSGLSFRTASGASPWQNTRYLPDNFLSQTLSVTFSPDVATLDLPTGVCANMAQYLPINFDQDTSYWLWNTSDPAYHDIISSPSYLNFTIGDTTKTSIRVPFALLNLTLDRPIKDAPVPYFPCVNRPGDITLGRAFLQSAFIMQAWGPPSDVFYIGQAPGPTVNQSTSTQAITLLQSNPDPEPLPNAPKWEDTWSHVLTPLGPAATLPSSTLDPTKPASPSVTGGASRTSGPSGGAIAGVVIGAVAVVAMVIGIVTFCIVNRRRSAQAALVGGSSADDDFWWYGLKRNVRPVEVSAITPVTEIDSKSRKAPQHEMSAESIIHELAGSERI